MKRILFALLFISTATFSQKSINNYKYIIVPAKFDFVKKQDQYQTSSLTKFLFNKKGFKAFLSNEQLPEDVAKNKCLSLTANVKDDSGMLTTKSFIELKDCYNNIVFTSVIGKSKLKEYKKAYHESIRNAFKSIQNLKYAYIPLDSETVKVDVVKNSPAVLETPKVVTKKSIQLNKKETVSVNILYAQPIANGFQFVNTKPEVVFKALKTNVKEVYILDDKNGILYKQADNWIAEYYKDGNKEIKVFQIKF
ncbi:MAG: hypothetical protein ACPGU6_01055 [Tenacibaculum sp.]